MSAAGQGPAPENDHRADRESGAVVYPVFSRRSGGLSVGVNLFPDAKLCSFDCPYCEVFPFSGSIRFSVPAMERGLRTAFADAAARRLPVKDVCFSGNGEPTLSPDFPAALASAAALRDEAVPGAALVVITNGSTLCDPLSADLLARAARPRAAGGLDLDVWLKLDAGTEAWYRKVDRGALSFDALSRGIDSFLARAPATIQTMLCAVDGAPPPAEEESAWLERLAFLARTGNVRRVQIYGKARPAPEDPAAEALPAAFLDARAARARSTLALAGIDGLDIGVYF